MDITFNARDNTKLAGTFLEERGPSIILLHQYAKDRQSWKKFAERLHKEGFTVLSFDFRGFGESELDKESFDVNDFVGLVSDVKAAKRFLENKNANIEKIFVIGASIGANTAINYAPIDPHVEGIVLLSPGLDYKGIKVEESVKVYQGSLLIVASEGDEYSAESSTRISEIADSNDKELKIYKGNHHGTDMFAGTDLEEAIVKWLKKHS